MSNRESGNGRLDIIMRTPSVRGMAIIMEIKIVKDFEMMEECCDAALAQIEKRTINAPSIFRVLNSILYNIESLKNN